MPGSCEQPLVGGRQTLGIVRVGNTVRRPPHARSGYVHQVLCHLETVRFHGAPRALGFDADGREILSYIEGEVPDGSAARFSDARLYTAAALIRRFHDATAGTALADGGEVVCHGDLGDHNTVFQGDTAVGLIDWDDGVAPGSRLCDFAHAVWCFGAVGEDALPVSDQAHVVRLMCTAYGWEDRHAIVDEIADRHRRARDDHASHGRPRAVDVFEDMIRAMGVSMPELKAQLLGLTTKLVEGFGWSRRNTGV